MQTPAAGGGGLGDRIGNAIFAAGLAVVPAMAARRQRGAGKSP